MTVSPTPEQTNSALQNILLTSVVISASVSALISGIFLFVNERMRRVSEEKRFKIDSALKLAELRDKQIIETAKHNKQETVIPSIVELFRGYLEEIEKQWKK